MYGNMYVGLRGDSGADILYEPPEMVTCEQCRYCFAVDIALPGRTGTAYICTEDYPMQVDPNCLFRADDCAGFEG